MRSGCYLYAEVVERESRGENLKAKFGEKNTVREREKERFGGKRKSMCAMKAPTVKVESVSKVTCKQKQYRREEE